MYPFQSILVHWFLKCGCSLLPSPVWPLPICLDSWTWHSRFLCNIALQHQTLLPSSIISTAGCCFCFGSVSSFFLNLVLHWFLVAYWAPTDLGSSSFNVLSFCFSYCSWGSQDWRSELVCHVLLQWTTFCQKSPPWPIHLVWPYMAWLSFTELEKGVVHVIRLVSLLWLFSVCLSSDGKG